MKIIYIHIILCFSLNLLAQDTIRLKEVIVYGNTSSIVQLKKIDNVTVSNQKLSNLLQNESDIQLKTYGVNGIQTLSIRGTQSNQSKIIWYGMPINSTLNGQYDLSIVDALSNSSISVLYGISSLQLSNGALGGIVYLSPKFDVDTEKTIDYKYNSLHNHTINLKYNLIHRKNIEIRNILNVGKGYNRFSYLNNAVLPNTIVVNKSPYSQFTYQNQIIHNYHNIRWWAINEFSYNYRNIPPLMTTIYKTQHNEEQNDQYLRSFLQLEKNKFTYSLGYNIQKYEYNLSHSINQQNVTAVYSTSSEFQLFTMISYNKKIDSNLNYCLQIQNHYNQGKFFNVINEIGFNKNQWITTINQQLTKKWNQYFSQKIILNQQNHKQEWFILPALMSIFNKNQISFIHSIGINKRNPTLNELYFVPGGNSNLKTEKSFQQEINFIHRIHHFQYRINPYFNKIENWILWLPTQFGYWQANNVRNINLIGITLNIEYHYTLFNMNNTLKTNYTFQHATGKDIEYTIKHNPYIPEHNITLSLTTSYKEQFFAFIELITSSKRYTMSYINQYYLNPYYLINVGSRILYSSKYKFEIEVIINNILNQNYQLIQWRPMPGRNFDLNLKFYL